MVNITEDNLEQVADAPSETKGQDKPEASKPKAKPKPRVKKVTVELPEDTVIDDDNEGEAEAQAEAEVPPAPEPKQGPRKVDLSNKEQAKPIEWVECEWCGKRVKKGGYGKHVANLAGDGIHPFKEELQAMKDAQDSTTTDNLSAPEEEEKGPLNEPWVIALIVGAVALVAMILFVALTRKSDESETNVSVTVPPATPAPETVQHSSEPAMVEDSNGNQVPIRVVRNADGTYSVAP